MIETQGNWDPARRGVFFQAGGWGGDKMNVARLDPTLQVPNLCAVNDFAEVGRPLKMSGRVWEQLMVSIDNGSPTFLDSGIFNLTNRHMRAHGTTMDQALALAPEEIDGFDWLFDVYCELTSAIGDDLWGYNELDQGGLENKRRTRKRLEAEGLRPIPVYHPLNDGWDYFDELATGYDRICYGNLVQASKPARIRLLLAAMERHQDYPDLFIHFLGLTPNEWQFGLPFDSADSSSWSYSFRFAPSEQFRGMGKTVSKSPQPWWMARGNNDALQVAADRAIIEMIALQTSLDHWHEELADMTSGGYYQKANT